MGIINGQRKNFTSGDSSETRAESAEISFSWFHISLKSSAVFVGNTLADDCSNTNKGKRAVTWVTHRTLPLAYFILIESLSTSSKGGLAGAEIPKKKLTSQTFSTNLIYSIEIFELRVYQHTKPAIHFLNTKKRILLKQNQWLQAKNTFSPTKYGGQTNPHRIILFKSHFKLSRCLYYETPFCNNHFNQYCKVVTSITLFPLRFILL